MNILWQEKLKELKELDKEQSWYIVKHNPDIAKLCYYVSFLEEFQKDENIRKQHNLQDYITKRVGELNSEKEWNITPNYRTLMVASYFGLIIKTAQKGDKYDDAPITETFQEIKNRCNGKFEDTQLYNDIVQRQIEKIFITSPIDNEFQGRRREFKLFPVIYLYKILLELGNSTGKYSIPTLIYNTLILTSHKYQDFLETLLLIKLLETEKDALENLEEIERKFSKESRWNLTLRLLDTLEITDDFITLKSEYISVVAKKVYLFEINKFDVDENNYFQFLGSTKSLINLEKKSVQNSADSSSPSPYTHPQQIIFYGVPGCGKSYKISEMLKDKNQFKIDSEEEQIGRTIFHPDYTNSDFVGQIMPAVDNGRIEYKFTPGPFTKILAKALKHSENQYVLVIEEINRGNAAAIFGEIFQLLDRIKSGKTTKEKLLDGTLNTYGEGWSEYFFMDDEINHYILKECNGDESNKSVNISGICFSENTGIRLPPNLSILATMNTSDQNVFTLDNAFQRRWDMKYIPNKIDYIKVPREQQNQYDSMIGTTKIRWGVFRDVVNDFIANPENSFSNAEDKQLGLFFISADVDISEKSGNIKEDEFANKVLKYLWNDIFKRRLSESSIFNENIKTFGELVSAFNGEKAFDNCFSKDFVESIKEINKDLKNE